MLTALLVAAASLSIDAATCDSLKSLSLPDTTIESATLIPAGEWTPLPSPIQSKPAPFKVAVDACRVAGVIKPAVKFEVWMPASNWNGKFQGVGGGGFAGVISYGAIMTALARGYATASTDTGHNTPGAAWAMEHPERIVDFAYRAIHEMTVKSKAIVKTFYGNDPSKSYFVGCSTGGRQGLMEAQRFPTDYDGIVAGAPANYWTHLMAGTLAPWTATNMDPSSRLSADNLRALNKGALAACDAQDGVADGLINNPLVCKFDPSTLLCKGGSTEPTENNSCLTQPQIDAAKKIYAPTINPRTKERIFPGMPPGGEITWTALTGSYPFGIPVDFYRYFVVSNPDWDWRTFDYDKDLAATEKKFGKLMNAVDPDLTEFAKARPPTPSGSGATGGKLIIYHGWNDQLIQPQNSIDYYTSVQKKMGEKDTDDFARLFMVPGMIHCGGGVGPNAFDAVTALEQWVEKGTKPAQMTASHMANGAVDRSRPLCPYPQVATWDGRGDIDAVASFACR